MPNKEEHIVPTSTCIGVKEARTLKETARTLDLFLTEEEFQAIIGVYLNATTRLLREGGIEQ